MSRSQEKLRKFGPILVEEDGGQKFKFGVIVRSNSEQAQIQSRHQSLREPMGV